MALVGRSERMRWTMKAVSRVFLTSLAIILISVLLAGCAESSLKDILTDGVNTYRDRLLAAQIPWLHIEELILLVIITILIILLCVLFFKHSKVVRQTKKIKIRAHSLASDNELLARIITAKTEFYQNISHDFKTLLTVISTSVLNSLDLLDFEMNRDEMQKSLKHAQSEIMRMTRIVDDAMKRSAMHDNLQKMEVVDIALLLRMMPGTYRAYLERSGNHMKLDVPHALPEIYGNADMILNVMSNLISNANRFTHNGEILISAAVESGRQPTEHHKKRREEFHQRSSTKHRVVTVTVMDNGEGIKPELLPTIFTRGVSQCGTGLGLSIAKTIVEAHGGAISVESEYTKGTKVIFTLPVYDKRTKERKK